MKMSAMGMDENGRSILTGVDIPLKQVSDTEWLSEKQDAAYWGLALSQPSGPMDPASSSSTKPAAGISRSRRAT